MLKCLISPCSSGCLFSRCFANAFISSLFLTSSSCFNVLKNPDLPLSQAGPSISKSPDNLLNKAIHLGFWWHCWLFHHSIPWSGGFAVDHVVYTVVFSNLYWCIKERHPAWVMVTFFCKVVFNLINLSATKYYFWLGGKGVELISIFYDKGGKGGSPISDFGW